MKNLITSAATALFFSASTAFSQSSTPAGPASECFAAPSRACLIDAALALTDEYDTRNARALLKGWLSAQLGDQAMFEESIEDARFTSPGVTHDAIFEKIATFQAEAGFDWNATKAAQSIYNTGDMMRSFGAVATTLNIAALFDELPKFALRYIGGEINQRGVLYILEAIAKSGRVDAAMEVAEAIPDEAFRALAFASIGAATRDADLVLQSLITAQTTAVEDEFSLRINLNRFPRYLVRVGQLDEALALVGTIESSVSRQIILSEISKFLAENGQFEDATTVAAMIEAVEYDSVGVTLSIYIKTAKAEIMIALANAGRIEEALTLLKDFKSAIWYDRVLADISIALTNAGRLDEAMALVNRIEQAKFDGYAKHIIASILAKDGRVQAALSLAQTIDSNYHKARAFAAIAMTLE